MARSSRPIDAVLCDVDGVLRHWDADVTVALERRYGLAAGVLLGTAFAPTRLLPAITGQVEDGEWRAGIAADLAERWLPAERATELVEAWSQSVGRLDEQVCELLTQARRWVPVALVSNGTTRLESDLARLGVTDRLNPVVVNSARIGTAKPATEIYLAAARAVGVPPERCLFVDDSPGHVYAAQKLGLTALLHRNADGLRAALAQTDLRSCPR